jgi:phosphate-selective porin OprO/OprP
LVRKIVLALTCLFCARIAAAKSLEEILKEKGVITEEEAAEAAKEAKPAEPPKDVPKVSYKMGDGFTFLSGDEKFRLTLGGRLQVQYEDYQVDKDHGNPANKHDSFRLRRVYTWLKGYVLTKDLTYKLQVDFKDPAILDAWLDYRLADELHLEAGQDVVPFARQEINSSAALQFVERSPTEIYYRPSYDAGAMVWGKIAKGLLVYNVGLFNGTGQNVRRTTPDNAVNARLVLNPFGEVPYAESDLDFTATPQFALGASAYYNRLHTDATGKVKDKNANDYVAGFLGNGVAGAASDRLDITMGEADLAVRYVGFYAQAEYFLARAKGKYTGAELKSAGWYAQAGYFLLRSRLEVAGRYSTYDPNTDAAATGDKMTETAGAVNCYFAKQAAKLQLEVAALYSEATKAHDLRSRLQVQLIF